MNEKTVSPVSIPEVLAIDFKKLPVLGAALSKRINDINLTRHVPVTTAARYIIELIEKDVSTVVEDIPAPKPTSNNGEIVPEGFFD